MFKRAYIPSVLAAVLILPLLPYLHGVIIAFFFFTLSWRVLHERRNLALPGKMVHFILTIVGLSSAFILHGKPIGIVPASAVLTVALGTLLIREVRDRNIILVFILSGILLICSAVLEQSIFTTLHLLAGFSLMILYLAQNMAAAETRVQLNIKDLLGKVAVALPVVIILFLVIPRTTRSFIPPILRNSAQTGFSDRLDPGSVASLISSDALAFRARFLDDERPATNELYWRGKTLAVNNGLAWEPGVPHKSYEAQVQHSPPLINTEVVLEPLYKDWLFTLDKPVSLSFADVRWQGYLAAGNDYSFYLTKTASERLLYQSSATLHSRDILDEDRRLLYLQLPQRPDPEVKALVETLLKESTDQSFARSLGQYLLQNSFTYTLEPGLMATGTVKEFLFSFKRGFCEHYAAVSAHLFRVAKIPARIVLGFHGGEPNNFNDYLSVRGKDAHAWTEYYDDNLQSWTRFDATQFIAPDRLRTGGQGFHRDEGNPLSESLALVPEALKKAFGEMADFLASISHEFNLFMLTFDFASQKNWLKKLNIDLSLTQLFITAFIILVLIGSGLFIYINYRRPRLAPEYRLYRSTVKKLAQHGLPVNEYCTPSEITHTLRQQGKQFLGSIQFLEAYISLRYSPAPRLSLSHLQKLYRQQFKSQNRS